jgi:hypothetical protein
MTELVTVSSIETDKNLAASIEAFFNKGHYAEITQAIGMHSLLIDPQHTMGDQTRVYRSVLDLLKDKIKTALGKHFSAWYVSFPKLMDEIVSSGVVITDSLAAGVLVSHREAFGPFKSVEDFFFWALDDRKLELDQIVKYIEKTAEMPCQ